MKERKVFTTNAQGEKLVGIETLPEGKGKFPAVILVHGFGVDKSEYGMFDSLAIKLAEVGIASYRFDFSGRGESGGNYAEINLTKLKQELEKIMQFVLDAPHVDKNRIAIHAQSLGTAVAIALAPKVKTIILTGSGGRQAQRLAESLKIRGNYNPNGVSSRKNSAGELIKINPEFWTDFKKYNTLQGVKKINCPVLFIHGSADDRVPLEDMEELYAEANEPKQKVVIQGAGHGFEPHREEMYKVAIEWLRKTLL